jgi:hypothetical protein
MNNNPVRWVDPTGHAAACPDCGGGNDLEFVQRMAVKNSTPWNKLPETYRNVLVKGGWSEDTYNAEFVRGPAVETYDNYLLTHIGVRTQVELGVASQYLTGVTGTFGVNWVLNTYSLEAGISYDFTPSGQAGVPGFGIDASVGPIIGGGARDLSTVLTGPFISGEKSGYYGYGGTIAASIPVESGENLIDTYATPLLVTDQTRNITSWTLYVGVGVGGGFPLPLSGNLGGSIGGGYGWGTIEKLFGGTP